MNEANIHFKINEYLIKLENKKDTIKELKNELENLDIKNKELHRIKNKLKEEFMLKEKNNKNLVNILISSNKNKIINSEFSNNIIGTDYYKKKRNKSANINRRIIDMDSVKEIKKKNKDLNNLLLLYKNELNNIIKQVIEKETKCKLLMFNAKNNANFYSKK